MQPPTKIDHLGIAVRSIEETSRFYRDVLGLKCTGIEEVSGQKVRVAFFLIGQVRIELLEPTAADSPIAKFLEKKGPGIHHVAYRVDDISASLEALKKSGVRLIDETPHEGAHGASIAFLHPKSTGGVLTELCEHSAG